MLRFLAFGVFSPLVFGYKQLMIEWVLAMGGSGAV